MEYRQAIATVDVVLLTLVDKTLKVVLLKRENEPFAQHLALPGGYVHPETDTDARAAAHRVLLQKTGIRAPYLEQLYTFSGPNRDPRGWSFSVTYIALVNKDLIEDKLSADVQLCPTDQLPTLAFDHNDIVEVALKRVRDKSSYSALPCYLLPREFTLPQLQATYEQVMGGALDKSSFRRKLDDMGFLEAVAGKYISGRHPPAQVYRVKPGSGLVLFDRTV